MKQRVLNAVNKTLEAVSNVGMATLGIAIAFAVLEWWVLPIMIILFIVYFQNKKTE